MTTNKPEVKRYTPAYGVDSVMRGHLFMEECERGAWVSLEDYEALQAECEEELFRVRQDRDTHFGEMMRALEQADAMKAEREKLHKTIQRLCNIYVVDDYYSGGLREEQLNRAVERAIAAAMQGESQ